MSTVDPTSSLEVAPVRQGEELNWEQLEKYLRTNLPELSGAFRVLQFPNGSANLTYLVMIGTASMVIRRPPFGIIAPGAHSMKREFSILSRLWSNFAPAPRGMLFCDDHDVIGSDFLVIEYRQGVVVWGEIPVPMRHFDDVARRIGFSVVDALADLHGLDPAKCGLEDLGRPEGFVDRQLDGWMKRWTAAKLPGTDNLMDDVGARLLASKPTSQRVSILHNDFKLDNCQFDPTDPDRVKSIFDWDMATLGDPFIDLGTLLNYWPDPSDGDDVGLYNAGMENLGLPSRAEVIERYAERSGVHVGEVWWYEAFACWRVAVILQQLHTRFVRGESTDIRMSERGALVKPQALRAKTLLDQHT